MRFEKINSFYDLHNYFFIFSIQYYYYGCECCRDVVEEIGVLGDCSKWGEPTGHDEFCTVVDKTELPKDKSNENSEIKVQQ